MGVAVALLLALLGAAPVDVGPVAGPADACVAGRNAPVVVAGHGAVAHLGPEMQARAAVLVEEAAAFTGAPGCAPIHVDLVEGMEDAASLSPAWRLPHWAAGAAQPGDRRVVVGVTAEGRRQDRERTLAHELAHVAITDAAGGRVPRWFDEGASRVFAGEHGDDDLAALARARLADRVTPLGALVDGFPAGQWDAALAYAVSGRAVRIVLDEGGPGAVARVLAAVRAGADFDDALQAATGRRTWQLAKDVERSISLRHALLIVAKDLELGMGFAAVLLVVGGAQARRRTRRRLAQLVDDAPRGPPAGVVLVRFRAAA